MMIIIHMVMMIVKMMIITSTTLIILLLPSSPSLLLKGFRIQTKWNIGLLPAPCPWSTPSLCILHTVQIIKQSSNSSVILCKYVQTSVKPLQLNKLHCTLGVCDIWPPHRATRIEGILLSVTNWIALKMLLCPLINYHFWNYYIWVYPAVMAHLPIYLQLVNVLPESRCRCKVSTTQQGHRGVNWIFISCPCVCVCVDGKYVFSLCLCSKASRIDKKGEAASQSWNVTQL